MDRILFWLACASALLLLLAAGVAWWEHRMHMIRVARQRTPAKDSPTSEEHGPAQRSPAGNPAATEVPQPDRPGQTRGPLAHARAHATAHRAPLPTGAAANGAPSAPSPQAAARATDVDVAVDTAPIGRARARSASVVPTSVLASRAELAAMEQVPTWEDTQPMVLETSTPDFEPTQMEPHGFAFEPTRPVDLSPH